MGNQQLYYTYISFDDNGKYYIGYSKNNIASGYKGSYRDKSFKPIGRLDLNVSEVKEIAMLMEYSYQSAWNTTFNPDFANLALCNLSSDIGFSSWQSNKDLKPIRSEIMKKRWQNTEYRAKMANINVGRTHSAETKAKMSKNSAMKNCPEARAKLSRANKGKIKSPEHIAKMKLKKRINNMLNHLLGRKHFNKYANISHRDLINEVQRLEREFVGLKSLAEKHSPIGNK